MKRIIAYSAIAVATVALLAIALLWHPLKLIPPLMPKVGEYYDYRVAGEIKKLYLRVLCSKASGAKRTLDVLYRGLNEKVWRKAYTVDIDYQAKFSDPHRVVVKDTKGRIVPRGKAVGIVPNPFHTLIVTPGYPEIPVRDKSYDLPDGWRCRFIDPNNLRLFSEPGHRGWLLEIRLQNADYKGMAESCNWDDTSWLWKNAYYGSDIPGDLDGNFDRIDGNAAPVENW